MARHGRTISADARVGKRLRFDRANITAGFDWLMINDQYVMAGELLLGSLAAYENYGYAAEAVALFHRCEQPIEEIDVDLVEQLRESIIMSLIVIVDFPTMVAKARQMRSSTNPTIRVTGCSHLAFFFGLSEPARAQHYLDEAAGHLALAHTERPGLNTDIAHGIYRGVQGVLFGYTGNYVQALAAIDDVPDNLTGPDQYITGLSVVLPQAAAYHILLGQPTAALERVEPFADLGYAYGALHEIDALVSFASDDVDTARHHVRLQATEAATGRLARRCNDAMMLLAELALVEGDHETAVHLITGMGIGRSPGTIAYSRDLATRLGVPDEHATREQAFLDPANLGDKSHAAMKALHAELTRRGWD
jgi:hypothetical protein